MTEDDGAISFCLKLMQRAELWKILSELIEREDLTLFDIDLPSSGSGVLRVYIHSPEGIQHSHCAEVSQRILNHPRVEEMMPGRTTLEVSSPGVNRKLTRSEHFSSALGERVRVTYRLSSDAAAVGANKNTITGLLQSFDGEVLSIEAEGKKDEPVKNISVPLRNVEAARIDFSF